MLIIKNKSYSIKSLQKASINNLGKNFENWEKLFWNFIYAWFDNGKQDISIKTSGSTGKPKIIFHNKKHMKASALATCKYFNLNKNKTALLCLPASSIGGAMMIVRALESRMNLIIEKASSNPLKNLKEEIDFVAMTPMQVQKTIIENAEKWLLIKMLIIGGGKVSNSLTKEIIKHNINAFSTFGMTETISHIALNKIGENKTYTALENCYFSKDDNDCLIISAKHIGIDSLKTNDIVELYDNKNFKWLGRKDNAIETGGIKIIPEIIEQKIAHLFTTRFFISSLPDKLLNNKIILLIENKNEHITFAELKKVLTKYECPKELFLLEKFDETINGKIKRKNTLKQLKTR